MSTPKLIPPENHRALDSGELKILPRDFFEAPTEQVARALLGKILLHRLDRDLLAGRIVETEAYLGEQDAAAHAASGRTARNAVLYGPPGHAYIYHIYGMHQCLNVSCLPDGVPGGVLLRALDPLAGLNRMRRNRGLQADAPARKLASGPGNLCLAFGITRANDNGRDLTQLDGLLGFYDDGFHCGEILAGPRVGIRKAADLPLRFFLARNECVSAGGWKQNVIDQSRIANIRGDRKQRA